ncbi:MAG: HdeA/HdeB family chaperone [Pseudomonadota bacterium]
MKKIIMLALALSLFVGAQTANADDSFNMTELTCDELLSDGEGFPYSIFWMAGYLGAQSGHPFIGGEIMTQLTETVAAMCQEKPDATVGQVLEALL